MAKTKKQQSGKVIDLPKSKLEFAENPLVDALPFISLQKIRSGTRRDGWGHGWWCAPIERTGDMGEKVSGGYLTSWMHLAENHPDHAATALWFALMGIANGPGVAAVEFAFLRAVAEAAAKGVLASQNPDRPPAS